MKWLVFLTCIALWLQQAVKPPEGKRVVKGKVPQISGQTNSGSGDNDNSAKPQNQMIYIQQGSLSPSQPNTAKSNEDTQIQKRIGTFTELLVIVAIVQAGILFMQWLTFRKQNAHFRTVERAWRPRFLREGQRYSTRMM